ncbi:MAG: hypothetical protein K2M31_05080 [Muribaculaceae bacterium]|nr:hypothetical protein [Muribaculaceae bacterium]
MNLKSNFLIVTLLTASLASNAEVPGQWVSHPTLDIYSYLQYSKFTSANVAQATNNVQKLIEGERYVYALITGGLYLNAPAPNELYEESGYAYNHTPLILARYDKNDVDGRMEPVATRLATSGLNVTAIEYSQPQKCLAVGYDNGCFDLIYDDGRILSNDDLKHFNQPGGLKFRSFSFTPDGGKVVIGADFGLVIADMATASIEKTCNFSQGVDFANIFQGNVILSADGILRAFPAGSSPRTLDETIPLKSSAAVAPAGILDHDCIKSRFGLYPVSENTILFFAPALASNVDGISINVLTIPENPFEDECRVANLASTSVNYKILGSFESMIPGYRDQALISPTQKGWMFHNETDIYMLDILGHPVDYSSSSAEADYKKAFFYTLKKDTKAGSDNQAGAPRYKSCATYDGRDFRLFVPRQGFSQIHVEGVTSGAKWTNVDGGKIVELNALAAGMPKELKYSQKYGLLARSDGRSHSFRPDNGHSDGLSAYKDGKWDVHTVSKTNYKKGWLYTATTLLFGDSRGLSADPVFPDYVYMCSQEKGIRRQNLADPEDIMMMTRSNYAPNFANRVIVTQPQNGSEYPALAAFSDFDYDNDGTLWTAFCRLDTETEPVHGELWYWTAADRGEVKDKNSYPGHEMKIIEIPGINGPMHGSVYALKTEKNKNLIVHIANNTWYDSYVYDHNGTLDDTSDDKWVVLKNIIDQNDDEQELLTWPYGFIEDPVDGTFIIGTRYGIYTTTREDLFSNEHPKLRLVQPTRESDGSFINNFGIGGNYGVVGMTLDAENRKWVVLDNGHVYCLSPDMSTVIQEFTPDNSVLPNTTYLSILYNPASNSIFVGCYYGLMEYCLAGGDHLYAKSTPSVSPRIIEPHYGGYVNICGLEDSGEYILLDSDGNEIALPKSKEGRLQLHPSDYPAGEYRLKDYSDVYFIINK